jgi:SAM-dependent methyltransferase
MIGWERVPVDDIGYISSYELMQHPDEDLMSLVGSMERTRYEGWRNWHGLWRNLLKLDDTFDADVLDYGCGVGIEALQYARHGNVVTVADVHSWNMLLASRVLLLHGYPKHRMLYVLPNGYLNRDSYDVVHMAGVLHHIREPRPVVEQVARSLRVGGELRMMLYSGHGWEIATSTTPPDDVSTHPKFQQFLRYFDEVGEWSDWYDAIRLEERFGDLLRLDACDYITQDGRYLVATMVKE